ncbi:ATP-binding protein [Pantanalinema rosaneae CENA516]|uniref:sensor histidine kinase n=1 Tax=Pantanalinema rosaneae TaxID=1620701 RepID=UPI003D6E1674
MLEHSGNPLSMAGFFMPHTYPLRQSLLVWLDLGADSLIALAYYTIAIVLLYFVRRRPDLPFVWILLLFSLVITACSTTYLLDAWTLWYPTYGLSGTVKAITAAISIYTAILLIQLMPQALALPNPSQLKATNQELEREVRERKQVEEQLRKSETALAQAQEIAHVGCWEFDVTTRQVTWSAEMFRIFGLPSEQPAPTFEQLSDLVHPDDREYRDRVVQTGIATKQPYDFQCRIVRPDGSIRYTLGQGRPICNDRGELIRVFGTTLDITDLKQTQLELSQTNSELQALFNAMNDTVLKLDREGRYLKVVANNPLLLCHPSEQLMGKAMMDMLPIATATQMIKVIQQALDTQQTIHLEYDLAINGRTVWFSANVSPLSAQEVVWVAHDISDRKQAEELLRQQAAAERAINTTLEQQVRDRTAELQQSLEFEALLKRITDKVRDSLDEHQILHTVVNELGTGLQVECCDTGIYNSELTIFTVAHEYNLSLPSIQGQQFTLEDNPCPEVYQQLFQGQCTQFCFTAVDQVRLQAERYAVLACPLLDDQGVLGDLWLFKQPHISFNHLEIRLIQQIANQCAIAIRQARLYQTAQTQVLELERLNHLKDDFLSTVSHELRTPISNVKMAIQMLELTLFQARRQDGAASSLTEPATGDRPAPSDSPRQLRSGLNAIKVDRYFQILKDECEREISLINDLLDLTRLESGTDPLILVEIDLTQWLAEIARPFEGRIAQQQQRLELDVSEDLPILVSDRSHLERILMELLNNACKYTPAGETIRILARTQPNAVIQLQVSNTGVELPADERDRIFDKFYRIPNHDPWKHGGTGLGLALVRRLVEQLGGAIYVESANQEVRFVVELSDTIS